MGAAAGLGAACGAPGGLATGAVLGAGLQPAARADAVAPSSAKNINVRIAFSNKY